MKKSLFNENDLAEIKVRISLLEVSAKSKWGKMNASQMLCHCDKILQVGLGKIILPKRNFIIKTIGIITKTEMKIFNNGILPNMPTFKEVKVFENCNFEKSRVDLLTTLDEFLEKSEKGNLLSHHELFGKMTKYDWGFLEYKHLNHHLKQFGI